MDRADESTEYATGPYAHEDIKWYVCQWCGLRWKNVVRYDNHRREDH